MPAEVDNHDDS